MCGRIAWLGPRSFLCALVLAAISGRFGAAPALAGDKPITLSFHDAAAADAILQFRWLAGVPIVFQPPAGNVRVSLALHEVPLPAALSALCQNIGYEYRKIGQVYALTPKQRPPLLPAAADIADRFLYSERQRLNAARLMLTLTPDQVARTAQGESLKYSELSSRQQELLGEIYGRLIAAARAGWIQGTRGLATAPATPPASLAFSIRGFIWRLEQPQQAGAPRQPAATPSGQPALPPVPSGQSQELGPAEPSEGPPPE
jgi:hypothetical protein